MSMYFRMSPKEHAVHAARLKWIIIMNSKELDVNNMRRDIGNFGHLFVCASEPHWKAFLSAWPMFERGHKVWQETRRQPV